MSTEKAIELLNHKMSLGMVGADNLDYACPVTIRDIKEILAALDEKPESQSEFTETYRKLLEQYGNHPLVEAGFIACAEIDQKNKRIKELEDLLNLSQKMLIRATELIPENKE